VSKNNQSKQTKQIKTTNKNFVAIMWVFGLIDILWVRHYMIWHFVDL